MDLSVSGSQGQYPSCTRVLLAFLAFMAEICGCRLLDQNPEALRLTGLYLGFHRLYTLESVLHLVSTSPSCNHSVLVPCGDYGSSRNLNLRFFSLSPSATLSHCVCVPCCGQGHLRVDLVLESQTNVKREQAVGFILTYLRHRF